MRSTILLFASIAFLTIQVKAQTVSDKDGNVYNTVTIGTQTWMKENLQTTTYNDGSKIPHIKDSVQFFNATSPAYCWYKNDSVTYNKPWGALYNWYTVNTGKLCPTGWHVPSNAEWHTLVLFLDPNAQDCYCSESTTASNALKESSVVYWGTGNSGTNSSGFSAVGTGFRNYFNKGFQGHTSVVYFWTSTPNTPYATVWHRYLANNTAIVYEYLDQKNQGMSVRCLKDNNTGIKDVDKKRKVIEIYPNPASDKVNIVNSTDKNLDMTIYNLAGLIIIQKLIISGNNEINVNDLPNGIYIIKVIGGNILFEQKFVKD